MRAVSQLVCRDLDLFPKLAHPLASQPCGVTFEQGCHPPRNFVQVSYWAGAPVGATGGWFQMGLGPLKKGRVDQCSLSVAVFHLGNKILHIFSPHQCFPAKHGVRSRFACPPGIRWIEDSTFTDFDNSLRNQRK